MQAKANEAYRILEIEGFRPNEWLALYGAGNLSTQQVKDNLYHMVAELGRVGPRNDVLVLRTTHQNGDRIERLFVKRDNQRLVEAAEDVLRRLRG